MSARRIQVQGRVLDFDAVREGSDLHLRRGDTPTRSYLVRRVGTAEFIVRDDQISGAVHTLYAIREGNDWWVHLDGRTWHLEGLVERGGPTGGTPAGLVAPIPATVTEVLVGDGDRVAGGQVLVVLSAMKMQLEIKAPHDGVVRNIRFAPGDQVDGGVALLTVEADAES